MGDSKMFQYEGHPVLFMPDGRKDVLDVLVNATQMAKPFGKKISHFLRDESRRRAVIMICMRNSLMSNEAQIRASLFDNVKIEDWANVFPDSIKVVKGGDVESVKQGTWFHEDIALEFARWLSPKFAVWCNDRIKELLRYGFTGTDAILESILNDPVEAAKLLMGTTQAIIEERRKNQELIEKNNKLIETLDEAEREAENKMVVINKQIEQLGLQAPKVEYHDKVLESTSLIRSTIIAKEVGMSAKIMHKKLKDLGVIWRVNGVWVPTAKYQTSGIAGTTTHLFADSTGKEMTSISIAWTEAGRKLIHELLDPKLKKQA